MVQEHPIVDKLSPPIVVQPQIPHTSSQTLNIKPIQIEPTSDQSDIEAILKEKIEKTNEKI